MDVEVIGRCLKTALHKACGHRRRVGVVRLLLDHGASVNAANKTGDMPLHLVSEGVPSGRGAVVVGPS